MFEVGVVGRFEAAHSLRGNFGPATRRHGHTYRVEVSVRGRTVHDDGTLCDIGLLQDALGEVLAGLHYRDLDELEAFRDRNSTAEVVARYLYEELAPRLLGQRLESLAVRVWESPGAWAAFEGSLAPVNDTPPHTPPGSARRTPST